MKQYSKLIYLIFIFLIASHHSFAHTSVTTSNRNDNKLGMYLALNEPAPTLFGFNVAYNAMDMLRISAGFGRIAVTNGIAFGANGLTTTEASATTLGLGAKAFMPGWNLSPTLGLHYSYVSYTGGPGLTVGGFEQSGSQIAASLGVDWQAKSGFNAGLGYLLSFRSGVGGSVFLSAGWFFNWLS